MLRFHVLFLTYFFDPFQPWNVAPPRNPRRRRRRPNAWLSGVLQMSRDRAPPDADAPAYDADDAAETLPKPGAESS